MSNSGPLRRSAVALLVACVAVGCEHSEEAVPRTPAPLAVHVAAARRGDIDDVVSVTGETAALSVLRLASPVAGRVTEVLVRPGDHLAAGAVAARVLPLENEAALHGFALLEGAGALGAEEQRFAGGLRKNLRGQEIPLRSPFPAVVADRLHNPGEHVASGEVLLELFDPDSLYVLAQVSMAVAARVGPGMTAETSSNGTAVPGTVMAVLSAVVPQSLTVPVRIALTAPLQPPLLHAAVESRITLAHHADVVLIPRRAVIASAAESATVMVASNGVAQRRTITLGLQTANECEVIAGLSAGERVLVDGQYALPDGALIQPVQGTPE